MQYGCGRLGLVLGGWRVELEYSFNMQESHFLELSIIEEYHKSQQYEEKYFDSVVDGMEEEGKLICPVCHA